MADTQQLLKMGAELFRFLGYYTMQDCPNKTWAEVSGGKEPISHQKRILHIEGARPPTSAVPKLSFLYALPFGRGVSVVAGDVVCCSLQTQIP